MRSLVVYYSRSGNTKFIAEKVAEELGAETEELIDATNRSGVRGFLRTAYDTFRGSQARLKETTKDPRGFDLIVLGTPVWNARPSSPIRTYLKSHDLSGKKAAIFCTNAHSSGEEVIRKTRSMIPQCDYVGHLVVSDALGNREDSERKISEWCAGLKSK